LAEIDLGLLENVLGMHVVAEANVRSGDLTEGMEAVTVADETITFSLTTAPNITDPNGFVSNIIVVDVQAMGNFFERRVREYQQSGSLDDDF